MVQIKALTPGSRRQSILKAASRIFREKGFHKAGMRDIAGSMGIAVGKLYYYFESKDHLLFYCQSACLGSLLEVTEKMRRERSDPGEQLCGILMGHILCLNDWIPGTVAHFEGDIQNAAWAKEVEALRHRYEQEILAVVQAGIAQRIFRSDDPKLAAWTVLGAVNWTVNWYRPEGRWALRTIAERMGHQLLTGLLVPGRSMKHRTWESLFGDWVPSEWMHE